MRERVVVTGAGCVSSLGIGTETFVDELLAGRSGIRPITAFSTEGCRSHAAALLRDFDPARFIEPLKLRRIDEIGRVALASCRLAVEDAGLPTRSDRVGVAVGSATAGLHATLLHMHGLSTAGPAAVPALSFSNTVGNAAASLCSIEFGLRGPNVTFAAKQVSSLAAIAYAVSALRDGRADAFLSGGFEDFEEKFFRVHDRFRILSGARGGEEASRPFDRRRNGFVLGTGGHILVLESARAALSRGARVRGEVLGVGAGAGRAEVNGWPMEPDGLVRTMRAALDDAMVPAAAVDAVFASANSTQALDGVEARALEAVFGPCGVPVVSLKGATGEFGAAGAAAIVAALEGLRRGLLPPTVGWETADPACHVDLSSVPRRARGRLALVNGSAAGGAHYSILVRACDAGEFEPEV